MKWPLKGLDARVYMVVTFRPRIATWISLYSSLFLIALWSEFTSSVCSYITDVVPMNCPTSGGLHITLLGPSLGDRHVSAHLRIEGTTCESTQWRDTNTIICKVARGIARTPVLVATMQTISLGTEFGIEFASSYFSYDKVHRIPILPTSFLVPFSRTCGRVQPVYDLYNFVIFEQSLFNLFEQLPNLGIQA